VTGINRRLIRLPATGLEGATATPPAGFHPYLSYPGWYGPILTGACKGNTTGCPAGPAGPRGRACPSGHQGGPFGPCAPIVPVAPVGPCKPLVGLSLPYSRRVLSSSAPVTPVPPAGPGAPAGPVAPIGQIEYAESYGLFARSNRYAQESNRQASNATICVSVSDTAATPWVAATRSAVALRPDQESLGLRS